MNPYKKDSATGNIPIRTLFLINAMMTSLSFLAYILQIASFLLGQIYFMHLLIISIVPKFMNEKGSRSSRG